MGGRACLPRVKLPCCWSGLLMSCGEATTIAIVSRRRLESPRPLIMDGVHSFLWAGRLEPWKIRARTACGRLGCMHNLSVTQACVQQQWRKASTARTRAWVSLLCRSPHGEMLSSRSHGSPSPSHAHCSRSTQSLRYLSAGRAGPDDPSEKLHRRQRRCGTCAGSATLE